MKGEKDNIKYSTEDICRYLDGQFSEQEMLALEKAALEDPFLSDAIEGIEESRNHPASFESRLEDLQKSLEKRINNKGRKFGMIALFPNWKIAASILFILGIAALTFTRINNKIRQSEIAKSVTKDTSDEKPVVKENDTSAISPSIPLPANSETAKETTAFNQPADLKKRSGQKNLLSLSQGKTPDSLVKKDDYASAYSSKTGSDTTGESASLNSVAKEYEPAPKIADYEKDKAVLNDQGLTRSSFKNPSGNYIKGVVTDEKGIPIPNATVSIKGAKKRTITDQSGFFILYALDPEFANQLIINSEGYESFSERISPDSSYTNIIQLMPASAALSEVVKKNSTEPAIGWDAFRNYINSNKKIQTADSLLKGEEIISFVVNKKSELSSFKIEKSISPAHDAEIIRLIKKAPPLKILTGKKKRLRINVEFK